MPHIHQSIETLLLFPMLYSITKCHNLSFNAMLPTLLLASYFMIEPLQPILLLNLNINFSPSNVGPRIFSKFPKV